MNRPRKTKDHRRLWLCCDRLLSHNLLKQLEILTLLLIFAMGLSFLFLSFSGVEWKIYCCNHSLSMWLLPLYLLIDSNALNNLYIDGCVEGRMLFSSSLTYLLVHHDIRPFEELDNIQELDREFSRYTPWIMRMTEDSIKTSSNEDETV